MPADVGVTAIQHSDVCDVGSFNSSPERLLGQKRCLPCQGLLSNLNRHGRNGCQRLGTKWKRPSAPLVITGEDVPPMCVVDDIIDKAHQCKDNCWPIVEWSVVQEWGMAESFQFAAISARPTTLLLRRNSCDADHMQTWGLLEPLVTFAF